MRSYTYFEISIYEFLLYSLGIRDKILFNHNYPDSGRVYNEVFSSDFLNRYGYITYENKKILNKVFRRNTEKSFK